MRRISLEEKLENCMGCCKRGWLATQSNPLDLPGPLGCYNHQTIKDHYQYLF